MSVSFFGDSNASLCMRVFSAERASERGRKRGDRKNNIANLWGAGTRTSRPARTHSFRHLEPQRRHVYTHKRTAGENR